MAGQPPPHHTASDVVGVGGSRLGSALVHTFTASGIVCSLFAMLAAVDQAWARAFAWLGLALLIDGLDGTFARLVRVDRHLPRFSGERLDMVIDYTTYVFVPALMLLWSDILSGPIGLFAAALILMSSLFHFCDLESKTHDNYFVGFPAIWNIVAFYFFAFALPSWLVLLIVFACVGLTFVPMRWAHPMRVRRWFAVNIGATVIWSAGAAWTIFVTGFPAGPLPKLALALVALYGMALVVALPWAADRGVKS